MRAADVAVLVIAEQRVDAAGVLRREPRIGDHQLARLVAIVLAQKVRPVFRFDVRPVDQVAREQQVRVTFALDQRLLEDLDHALVVAHAALQVRADEQSPSVREPDHAGHAYSK